MSAEAIKVAVRVRPFNEREKKLGSVCVVKMEGPNTIVNSARQGEPPKTFTYDFSYWSHDPKDSNFADQDKVMGDIGSVILGNALNGFNGCLFAYGQTGSGKSYSVMGYGEAPGIIPRSVDEIFAKKKFIDQTPDTELRVWVSYVEIYNEQVRDLLHASDDHAELKVMDHPKLGVYIPGLTESPCESPGDVQKLMDFGTKKRVTAATQMNATSSRSHAVFAIKVQHLEGKQPQEGQKDDRKALNAKINLVDLAGSERQSKTGAEGSTLKEGCAINQSLSALGLVIKELSEAAVKKGGKEVKVPFRASKLTFLLKDSLSGNSKTYMIAAISPASDNLEESISTLRFASSVKKIKTVATQNKDKKDEMIDNLQEEIKKLKAALKSGGIEELGEEAAAELQERQRLLGEMNVDYHAELQKAKEQEKQREDALADSGLSQDEISGAFGVDKDTPYLLNMADDPMLAGCLLYFVAKEEPTTIGKADDNKIKLAGIGIPDYLCRIENLDNKSVTIEKVGAAGRIVVNGKQVQEGDKKELHHNDKVFLGRAYALKLTLPMEAANMQASDTGLSLEGLEDEWSALEDSPSWGGLQMYLDQVLKQMPGDDARRLFDEVKEGCKFCDEANEITVECRPNDLLRFEVDLTSSIPPSVAIRVWHGSLPEDAEELDQAIWRAMYFWSVTQMAERLERMRDCYEGWSKKGLMEIDVLLDPWNEAQTGEIASRLTELEVALSEANQELQSMKYEKQNKINRTVMLWQQGREPNLRPIFAAWAVLAKSNTEGKKKASRTMASRSSTVAFAKGDGSSPRGKVKGAAGKAVSKAVSKKSSSNSAPPPKARDEPKAPPPPPEKEMRALPAPEREEVTSSRGSPQPKSSAPSVAAPEPAPEARAPEWSRRGELEDANPEWVGPPQKQGTFTPELPAAIGIDGEQAPSVHRENDALRKQLQAAWELCSVLRSRVRDQEELRRLRHEVESLRDGPPAPTERKLSPQPSLRMASPPTVQTFIGSQTVTPQVTTARASPIGGPRLGVGVPQFVQTAAEPHRVARAHSLERVPRAQMPVRAVSAAAPMTGGYPQLPFGAYFSSSQTREGSLIPTSPQLNPRV